MGTIRHASCRCGQLTLACAGEPVRVSVCHCLHCRKRSGSAFAAQARFAEGDVAVSGEARVWETTGESGNVAQFHFCPLCGSTVHYRSSGQPGLIAVAVGAFADSTFPPPHYSVFEARKHGWVVIAGNGIQHFD
jgi:hypothetical protein